MSDPTARLRSFQASLLWFDVSWSIVVAGNSRPILRLHYVTRNVSNTVVGRERDRERETEIPCSTKDT